MAATLAADASKSMAGATGSLRQANQTNADGAERKALEALYKLRELLQQQAAMAQNQPPDQQANAAAENAAMANFDLQRAQAQIAQAMTTMTPTAKPAAMQQASAQLKNAEASVAEAQQASQKAAATPEQQAGHEGSAAGARIRRTASRATEGCRRTSQRRRGTASARPSAIRDGASLRGNPAEQRVRR